MVAAFKQNDFSEVFRPTFHASTRASATTAAPTISTTILGDISKAPDCF